VEVSKRQLKKKYEDQKNVPGDTNAGVVNINTT
jgi:hypothetical protein